MGTWVRRFARVLAYSVVVSALSAACGGDSDDDDPSQPATSSSIGQEGGVVGSPSGAQIYVPAGALDAPTALTISVAADAPELPGELATLGDVYALTPHGQEFNQAVTIRIPYAGGSNPVLYTAPDGGSWSLVEGARRGNGVMSADVTHFSFFVVVEGKSAGGGGAGNSGGSPTVGDGGSGSAQAGSGSSDGGSTGSSAGGVGAQGGSTGSDGGGSPAGGAGGAGGSTGCGPCGGDGQPCCPAAGAVMLGNCIWGNGSCNQGYVCTTPGTCAGVAP